MPTTQLIFSFSKKKTPLRLLDSQNEKKCLNLLIFRFLSIIMHLLILRSPDALDPIPKRKTLVPFDRNHIYKFYQCTFCRYHIKQLYTQ